MLKSLLIIGISFFCFNLIQAQDYKKLLVGQWEDELSNNEKSFQFVVTKDQQFVFVEIAQANINEKTPITEDKLYNYKWLSDNIFSYSKVPDSKDKLKAELYPPTHTLIRVNSLDKDHLNISFCDIDFSKHELDSILKTDKDLSIHIGKRKAKYKKLDLTTDKKKIMLLGLWEDPQSNDSTSFQLFVQKGVLGFLKVKQEDRKKPTAIKPNGGYNYKWISKYVIAYSKQPATGLVKKDNNPNKYSLMRVEVVNRKQLVITLGVRAFNKVSLEYITDEQDLNQYFGSEQIVYRKIKVVKEDCKGTEVVKIGGKDVIVAKKPIIYLYPEQEQEVNVKVNFKGEFTHTYPKYIRETGWTVKAAPNGTLIDPKTNKEYYSLYWEGENHIACDQSKGFVVKGENAATFLEEKCTQLGLSAREANEFIIYWLPYLENNAYNFIHFSTNEYQAQAPMEITPKPDALIRVFMLFKGLDSPMKVEAQDLGETPVRKGFTVVEWGGATLDTPFTKLK